MLPEVAEVIFVGEAFILAEFEIAQSHQFWILCKADATIVVHAIILAVDAELV